MILSFGSDVWLTDGAVSSTDPSGHLLLFFAETTPLRHRRVVRLHNLLAEGAYALQAVGETSSGAQAVGDEQVLRTEAMRVK